MLCSTVLKRFDFYKAHHSEKCALIGQLSSALWLAEYLKRETEAFVIGETTNNKHYSIQLKTRVWIVSGKFFKYENIQAVSQKRQTCKVGIAPLYRNSLWA